MTGGQWNKFSAVPDTFGVDFFDSSLPSETANIPEACSFDQEPLEELRIFPAGSVVVNMNQRTARVIAHLLEPKGPDSLVQWGFFNANFEQVGIYPVGMVENWDVLESVVFAE